MPTPNKLIARQMPAANPKQSQTGGAVKNGPAFRVGAIFCLRDRSRK